jgi:hypothetical protein
MVKAPPAAFAVKIFFGEIFSFASADVIVSRAAWNLLRLTPFVDLQRSPDADLAAVVSADRGTSLEPSRCSGLLGCPAGGLNVGKLTSWKLHVRRCLCQAIEFRQFPEKVNPLRGGRCDELAVLSEIDDRESD